MDREYKYLSSGVSHHHGFISYSSGEYVDSVAQEGMTLSWRISEILSQITLTLWV